MPSQLGVTVRLYLANSLKLFDILQISRAAEVMPDRNTLCEHVTTDFQYPLGNTKFYFELKITLAI